MNHTFGIRFLYRLARLYGRMYLRHGDSGAKHYGSSCWNQWL